MRSRIVLGTLLAGIGGMLGFVIQEALIPHDPVLQMPVSQMARLGAIVGACLGAAIGLVEGVATSSPRRMARGALLGLAIGALGGVFGILAGGSLYRFALMGRDPMDADAGLGLVQVVMARALGWSLLGALPGLAAGASTLSHRRALHGLIGGLLGGLLGGVLFDLVARALTGPVQGTAAVLAGARIQETGGPSRAIGFTLIGAFTGFFIGLVGEIFKRAWVRVLVARNEGRDVILMGPLSVIGRDERAEIPVFTDPGVAPQHAAIRFSDGGYLIEHGGQGPATLVNGAPVQRPTPLAEGDVITIGTVHMQFHVRGANSPTPAQLRDAPQQRPAVPALSGSCPYCGSPCSASGACACSPTGAAGAGLGPVGHRLVGTSPSTAGLSIAISDLTLTVGRDPVHPIAIAADPSVSRNHARIVFVDGSHIVYDEGSSNGTFVNGRRVTEQVLVSNDTLRFGTAEFRYD